MTGGTATAPGPAASPASPRRVEVSPAAKLCGFLILMVLVFVAAYAAGARLGPVTTGHSQPAHGGQMKMNMGAPAGPAAARR